HGLSAMQEADEGGPERDAGDEALGAVDGIKHPSPFGLGAHVAVLFADDAVLRKAFGDQFAHHLLGAAVGGGDGGLVGLELHRGAGIAEVGGDERGGGGGEFGGEVVVGGEVHGMSFSPRKARKTRKIWLGAVRSDFSFVCFVCF